MTRLERRLAWLERRGQGLALFIARVAERGDVAETELADLAILRLEWASLRMLVQSMGPRP